MTMIKSLDAQLIAEMPVKGYPAHELALRFPMMEGEEYENFEDDVKDNGLIERIVLVGETKEERKVLDGRNRQKACLKTGQPLRFRMFDPELDGKSYLKFIVSKNLKRRHIPTKLRAAIAVELIPLFEAEAAAENNSAPNGARIPANGAEALTTPRDEMSQETGFDPAAESQAPPKKRGRKSKGGKASAKAAAAMGVSARSVERAKARKDKDPKAHEELLAGKAKPKKKEAAGAKGTPEYDKALERIEKVCGKQMATGVKQGSILSKPADLMLYASQTDAKMLALRSLLNSNWKLEKALLYKAEKIQPTHRVTDLASRAMYAGGLHTEIVNMGAGFLKLTIQHVRRDGTPIKFN